MRRERGVTVHFIDGSKMDFDVPPLTVKEDGTLLKLKEVIRDRHLMFEVDGALLLMPFENIKYVQVYPMPTSNLPSNIVQGAKLAE